jgi:hypothetical protein
MIRVFVYIAQIWGLNILLILVVKKFKFWINLNFARLGIVLMIPCKSAQPAWTLAARSLPAEHSSRLEVARRLVRHITSLRYRFGSYHVLKYWQRHGERSVRQGLNHGLPVIVETPWYSRGFTGFAKTKRLSMGISSTEIPECSPEVWRNTARDSVGGR